MRNCAGADLRDFFKIRKGHPNLVSSLAMAFAQPAVKKEAQCELPIIAILSPSSDFCALRVTNLASFLSLPQNAPDRTEKKHGQHAYGWGDRRSIEQTRRSSVANSHPALPTQAPPRHPSWLPLIRRRSSPLSSIRSSRYVERTTRFPCVHRLTVLVCPCSSTQTASSSRI